jgi:methionyl-tRNA formyltransferase
VILKHDQRLEDGSYESWFKKDAARIDWSKSADEVYALIRAANPAPGAASELNGVAVQIYDSARVDGSGTPGDIVSVSGDGITVQAADGRILIKRLRPAGGDKQAAAAWAEAQGLTADAS